MQSYRLSVSKDGKKYTIVFKAETEKLAKERVHKEGYSILSVEENNEKKVLGNIFIFKGYNKNGELKFGKIVGDDILKIYIKLRKDLEYDVREIYAESDSHLSDKEKEKILFDLKDEFNLSFTGKRKEKIDELRDKINKEKDKGKKQDNFYLKKELEETYKIINYILIKLENLLSEDSGLNLDLNQKNKLKTIYNSIIKLKKITNLSKLREIGELALIKIGRIEIKELEKKQSDKAIGLLKDTNQLLKKLGSKESFKEKDKDIRYIFNNFVNNFFNKLSNNTNKPVKRKKVNKDDIDKYSHSYIKNILFLRRYKDKLKENNIFFFKNIFKILLNSEERLNFLIRRKVIKQNITLFKAKEKGIMFSYTYVKKGFSSIINYILKFLYEINQYLFIIIVLYITIFITFLNVNLYYDFKEPSYEGIFYFIILLFVYLILFFTKNLFLIILNFVILFFIIIFGLVNF